MSWFEFDSEADAMLFQRYWDNKHVTRCEREKSRVAINDNVSDDFHDDFKLCAITFRDALAMERTQNERK